jgi:flagellar motility protein MotE (MotC chaperone)
MIGNYALFPLLILVAFLSFAVRLGDIVTDVKTADQVFSGAAMAEEKPAAKEGESKEGDKAEPVNIPEGLAEDEPSPVLENEWADPTTIEMEFSGTQTTVLQELKERRTALDSRESRIAQREALMTVTEKRIEEKIVELESIRTEIEELLGKQSEEEEARLQSLVKIYEGMKPKDAASIFDNLDMGILLQVVSRMSERKSAPIMASMDTKRAQDLTTLLAEQKKLPELPQ